MEEKPGYGKNSLYPDEGVFPMAVEDEKEECSGGCVAEAEFDLLFKISAAEYRRQYRRQRLLRSCGKYLRIASKITGKLCPWASADVRRAGYHS